MQCQSCHAVMVFDPARVGQNCEFCGSPALVDYDEIKAPIRPQGVLPFRIDQPAACATTSAAGGAASGSRPDGWRARRSSTPSTASTFRTGPSTRRVHCPWEAEAGYYYYVDVEGRDSKGNRVTRQERRVRWEPASGVVDHFFDDEPVPGTQGLPLDLLRQVEPFPTQEVVPYDTAFLSGHVVEHYRVVLIDAAKQSQEQMYAALMRLCAAQVPGDTQRNLRIDPTFSGRTFKHVLVPIWLLSYNYGARAFQVVVNGYTGKIAGRYPYSVWKIVLLVLLAIVGVLILAMLKSK